MAEDPPGYSHSRLGERLPSMLPSLQLPPLSLPPNKTNDPYNLTSPHLTTYPSTAKSSINFCQTGIESPQSSHSLASMLPPISLAQHSQSFTSQPGHQRFQPNQGFSSQFTNYSQTNENGSLTNLSQTRKIKSLPHSPASNHSSGPSSVQSCGYPDTSSSCYDNRSTSNPSANLINTPSCSNAESYNNKIGPNGELYKNFVEPLKQSVAMSPKTSVNQDNTKTVFSNASAVVTALQRKVNSQPTIPHTTKIDSKNHSNVEARIPIVERKTVNLTKDNNGISDAIITSKVIDEIKPSTSKIQSDIVLEKNKIEPLKNAQLPIKMTDAKLVQPKSNMPILREQLEKVEESSKIASVELLKAEVPVAVEKTQPIEDSSKKVEKIPECTTAITTESSSKNILMTESKSVSKKETTNISPPVDHLRTSAHMLLELAQKNNPHNLPNSKLLTQENLKNILKRGATPELIQQLKLAHAQAQAQARQQQIQEILRKREEKKTQAKIQSLLKSIPSNEIISPSVNDSKEKGGFSAASVAALLRPSMKEMSYKEEYKKIKMKFECLVMENEYYQEELRSLQRKLLKLSRDKNFLLDRLLQFEAEEESSEDEESDISDRTDTDDDCVLPGREKPSTSGDKMINLFSKASPSRSETNSPQIVRIDDDEMQSDNGRNEPSTSSIRKNVMKDFHENEDSMEDFDQPSPPPKKRKKKTKVSKAAQPSVVLSSSDPQVLLEEIKLAHRLKEEAMAAATQIPIEVKNYNGAAKKNRKKKGDTPDSSDVEVKKSKNEESDSNSNFDDVVCSSNNNCIDAAPQEESASNGVDNMDESPFDSTTAPSENFVETNAPQQTCEKDKVEEKHV